MCATTPPWDRKSLAAITAHPSPTPCQPLLPPSFCQPPLPPSLCYPPSPTRYAVVHFQGPRKNVHTRDHVLHDKIGRFLSQLPGVTEVLTGAEAAGSLELPRDRLGDWVVLAGRGVVLGKREEDHDVSLVHHLRSHGGRWETMVPLIVSHPLTEQGRAIVATDLRNFDAFRLGCNGIDRRRGGQ